MEANEQRREVMRRLGRDWEYPEERAFVGDYVAGRVPTCRHCGITIPDRFLVGPPPQPLVSCTYCYDQHSYDEDRRWHSVVLVEEGDPSCRVYWFWCPDPVFERDCTLHILWQHFGSFTDTDRARERLGGEWVSTPESYFRGQLESQECPRYLRLDQNHTSYLTLASSPAPGPPGSRWPLRPCRVLHAGHPRSRHPKRALPKRYRKSL
jgi:hypothetical protein